MRTHYVLCVLSAELSDLPVQVPLPLVVQTCWQQDRWSVSGDCPNVGCQQVYRHFLIVCRPLHKTDAWRVCMEAEVVVLLHARQNLEVAAEVSLPVMDRDELLTILSSDELRFVDFGTIVDNCLQVCEAGGIVAPESLLQQTKAPVGGKLCVPCNKKVEGDGPVLASQHSPGTVPQHVAIFVLPCAVVAVQAGISLSQAIPCEEEVEERNDCIRPLRHQVFFPEEQVHDLQRSWQ